MADGSLMRNRIGLVQYWTVQYWIYKNYLLNTYGYEQKLMQFIFSFRNSFI